MDDLAPIPPLAVGDQVEVREITPNQHFTEPPPRFSEASLVKELERLGIGRPSTYSAIISTLTAREYVRNEQRRFFPTELGETVEKVMVGKFPEIFNVEFTSLMEDELDRIEEAELEWQEVLHNFYGPFTKALEAVDINALVMEAHGLYRAWRRRTVPSAARGIELKSGRFGPYIACVNYKDTCDYAQVAQEAQGSRQAERRKVPALRIADGDQDRPVRRVPRLHHLPQVQGHPVHLAGHQVSQVPGRRPGRAADQAGQVVLGLHPLPGLRLLHLEQAGGGDLPRMRLGRDGEEGQQGRRGVSHLHEVRAQGSRGRAREEAALT